MLTNFFKYRKGDTYKPNTYRNKSDITSLRIDNLSTENPFQFSFSSGMYIYEATYEICKYPLCSCCEVHLFLKTINDLKIDPEIELIFDLENRKITCLDTSDTHYKFLKIFEKEMNDNDWLLMIKFFLDEKIKYTEQADLKTLETIFPIEEIEQDARVVSFANILPFTPRITFEYSNQILIVEDLYCVNPICNCGDVHLFFSIFTDDRLLFPFMNENPDETYLIYNINTNDWNLEEQKVNHFPPHGLMKNFSQTYDIQALYRQRYQTMRQLYELYKKRISHSRRNNNFARIGPNDLCPCGSGKKYKKCCMINYH